MISLSVDYKARNFLPFLSPQHLPDEAQKSKEQNFWMSTRKKSFFYLSHFARECGSYIISWKHLFSRAPTPKKPFQKHFHDPTLHKVLCYFDEKFKGHKLRFREGFAKFLEVFEFYGEKWDGKYRKRDVMFRFWGNFWVKFWLFEIL